ncbi:MAG: glycosyltransferase family 4 protein [Synechococcaceae cyanobacterium]
MADGPRRILFATMCTPSLETGGSKTQLELAGELEKLGWRAEVLEASVARSRPDLLQSLDVADWDLDHVLERSLLPPSCLSVARIPIFCLRQRRPDDWPTPVPSLLQRPWEALRGLLGRSDRFRWLARQQRQARRNLLQADLINPWNSRDLALLQQLGSAGERLVLLPPGLSDARRAELAAVAPPPPDAAPVIAMVSAFDFRKGALDLPRLFARLRRRHPRLRLRLLGTDGHHQGEAAVRRRVPAPLQAALEVVPRFRAHELPGLLDGVSLGVFPSYMETFGLGVIEQLAAGTPVVAYDVAGPCDTLPADWLVPAGQWRQLADRASGLLEQLADPSAAAALRQRAQERCQPYRWRDLALRWDGVYREHLAWRRQGLSR